jgi:hypothetical protein
MCGDAGDAEAGADVVGNVVRQRDRLVSGNGGVLRGGADGSLGLGAIDPDMLAYKSFGNVGAASIDASRPIAVRNDAGERHRIVQPAGTVLDVTGINPGH